MRRHLSPGVNWSLMGGQPLNKPTVSLGVTSAVVSSCGHDSGQIEPRVAHELAGHWATPEGPAERPQHCHPPHAQPLAPVRPHQGRRPRLTPRGCTDPTRPSDEGQPCGRLREEQRPHRSLVPREAMPRRRSSCRLLAMASPSWMIYVSYCYKIHERIFSRRYSRCSVIPSISMLSYAGGRGPRRALTHVGFLSL